MKLGHEILPKTAHFQENHPLQPLSLKEIKFNVSDMKTDISTNLKTYCPLLVSFCQHFSLKILFNIAFIILLPLSTT